MNAHPRAWFCLTFNPVKREFFLLTLTKCLLIRGQLIGGIFSSILFTLKYVAAWSNCWCDSALATQKWIERPFCAVTLCSFADFCILSQVKERKAEVKILLLNIAVIILFTGIKALTNTFQISAQKAGSLQKYSYWACLNISSAAQCCCVWTIRA